MGGITKAETARRINYHYMADAMRRLEWDLHQKLLTEGRIPEAWHEIALERGEAKRIRVTIALEEDVVRFFRGMGAGYGPRMNAVLRAFMHARLAGLLRGGETMDYLARREAEGLDGYKPLWGDTQEGYETLAPGAARLLSEEPGVPIGDEERAARADTLAWMRGR